MTRKAQRQKSWATPPCPRTPTWQRPLRAVPFPRDSRPSWREKAVRWTKCQRDLERVSAPQPHAAGLIGPGISHRDRPAKGSSGWVRSAAMRAGAGEAAAGDRKHVAGQQEVIVGLRLLNKISQTKKPSLCYQRLKHTEQNRASKGCGTTTMGNTPGGWGGHAHGCSAPAVARGVRCCQHGPPRGL